ncbi:MAG: hypothetical protein IV086_06440 [Hyphomonadaceae bacterium]|nr:MAG: hypothetical protein FD160_2726 [Caulobacteraceae bacterium]MBT9445320.1 hypothetical protein [Hyphomonadaceae bacterium]TPW05205.1 MAG: hypothetical protein FD124_2270 [Alphaproteobacteria bacterium]
MDSRRRTQARRLVEVRAVLRAAAQENLADARASEARREEEQTDSADAVTAACARWGDISASPFDAVRVELLSLAVRARCAEHEVAEQALAGARVETGRARDRLLRSDADLRVADTRHVQIERHALRKAERVALGALEDATIQRWSDPK